MVRWQEEQTVDLQGPTRVRDYVSERGDRLRVYLDPRIPIEYALEPADGSRQASLRLSADLAYFLGAGRLTPIGLARLVYQVPDPDLYQVMEMRRLAESVKPGQSAEMTVDRTRKYLDPVREAMTQAREVEPVPDEGRDHLKRAVFAPEQGLPYFAVEDAMSGRADVADLPRGQVFRVEYGRDGVVRVSYMTGDDDRRGRRDPYRLRETERWTALYDRYLPGRDNPVAWGPGEPSDLDPFPTARDSNRRVQEGERSYDYLVAGRAIVLTFRPTRSKADALAEAEMREALKKPAGRVPRRPGEGVRPAGLAAPLRWRGPIRSRSRYRRDPLPGAGSDSLARGTVLTPSRRRCVSWWPVAGPAPAGPRARARAG